jgi:hypothetical protein
VRIGGGDDVARMARSVSSVPYVLSRSKRIVDLG